MKQWYVIAYDVRESKRLQRVHYFLKKHAVALQNSVFLLHSNQQDLQKILQGILVRCNGKVDDVRLYPIIHPNAIWASGLQSNKIQGFYAAKGKARKKTKSSFIKTLFGFFNNDPR